MCEVADYKSVAALLRNAYAGEAPSLPGAVHTRLAHRAAAEALEPTFWSRLVPIGAPSRLAAVIPTVLLLAGVAIALAVHGGGRTVARTAPERLDIQVEGSDVRLAWSDGKGRPYKVYKSNDPRLLGQGEAHIVMGDHWVDRDAGSSQVVFYRVE